MGGRRSGDNRLPYAEGLGVGEELHEVGLGEDLDALTLAAELHRLRRLAGGEVRGVAAGEAVADDQQRGPLRHGLLDRGAAPSGGVPGVLPADAQRTGEDEYLAVQR